MASRSTEETSGDTVASGLIDAVTAARDLYREARSRGDDARNTAAIGAILGIDVATLPRHRPIPSSLVTTLPDLATATGPSGSAESSSTNNPHSASC